MKIQHLLEDTAKRYPSKSAVIIDDQSVTFPELKVLVYKLANALKAQGVRKGDKIGIYLPNCLEYIYSYLAIFCLGAVGVPLDYMLKEDELISCLEHAETKFLIAKTKNGVVLDSIPRSVGPLQKLILIQGDSDGNLSFEQIIQNARSELEPVDIQETDPALIMYTSGTTGRPKGILLNYKHLEGSPRAMEYFVDLSDNDVKLCAIPLSHIAGLIYIQNCVLFGISLIVMSRFNPLEFLKNIAKYHITCFHVVPAMYTAILFMKEIDRFDLSSLRWIVVFGAPSSPKILKRFHQYCPNAYFLNGWGMTETCPPNTVTPLGSNRIESVGKPSPHAEIKLFNDDDREVAKGETGEIVIRGWVVMQEYYKDSDLTKKAKRNGWFHTGDLGRFDEEGYLYIVGRKKEMIKVGGQIVFAPEIEAALHKHEDVAEVAVIGIGDKIRGEIVKAFVVLREKGCLTPEDVRYFAREHLAHFKVPHDVEICEALPKNRTGKIDKEQLRIKN